MADEINNDETIDRSISGRSGKGELSADATLGQYRIIRLLGRGGMGEVYEVEHQVLRRRYAFKLIPRELVGQKEFLERFKREAEVMANLEHTHIVKVDEFGETGGKYWLRMELVEGVTVGEGKVRSLAELAEYGRGKIEQSLLANVLSQVLDGLSYAHGKGAIHRDLKPANILLAGKDTLSIEVKISDFGLVRLVGEEWVRSRAEQSVSISMSLGDKATEIDKDKSGTSTRSLLGTYEYMSPEQKRGEDVDVRSDLYAVGLIIHRLLTGERELGYELPSEIDSKLVSDWDDVVRQALKPKKEQRFSSARNMAELISKVQKSLKRRLEEERERKERRKAEEEEGRQEAIRNRQEEDKKKIEEERSWKKREDQRKEAGQERKQRQRKKILVVVLMVLVVVGVTIGIKKARQEKVPTPTRPVVETPPVVQIVPTSSPALPQIRHRVTVKAIVSGWQDAGVVVNNGNKISFTARGNWHGGGNHEGGPYGCNAGGGHNIGSDALAPNLRHMALVGKIGNSAPFYIGNNREIASDTSGTLYLGCNDVLNGNDPVGFRDNTGLVNVDIVVN